MDFEKLDLEIQNLLDSDLSQQSYSDVKERLKGLGYSPEEMKYILQTIDDQGLIPMARTVNKSSYLRNIILGAILCGISLVVVMSLYLGQSTLKEVYFVALAIFAVGYLILRSGLKQKQQLKEPEDPWS